MPDELIAKARTHVKAMTPAQRAAMYETQRQSFVRAFLPAGYGLSDAEIIERMAVLSVQLSLSPAWGAAVSEMAEERDELRLALEARRPEEDVD